MTHIETQIKLPRTPHVKNKNPAPIQITAEQIIREAREGHGISEIRPPKQKICDKEELNDHHYRTRKEFEDKIRRAQGSISVWIQYAAWEESQKDLARARSVWERALCAPRHREVTLWLKYAEMEMKNKCINRARNVWDRSVTILPRVDQLWYKYIHMEEMLGNTSTARTVFERWMEWQPDHHGWSAYIKFELRRKEVERARRIYERYVESLPSVKAWVKYAKFEVKYGGEDSAGRVQRARACFERAITQILDEDEDMDELFIAFAEFEESCKEIERARGIYQYSLDHTQKCLAEKLYKKFMEFEKRHGDVLGIEDVVIARRRFQYEQELEKDGTQNYQLWHDYAKLEENAGNVERVREVYERAIVAVPPIEEKRYWKQYIYLWINYAMFEELTMQDMHRAREVYKLCRRCIPHRKFSFAKIWILAAQFEIRQKDLAAARSVMDEAIRLVPTKDKIFKAYIEMELQLGNIDKVRTLYQKYVEWDPTNCHAWSKFAELERALGEADRARAILNVAISQPLLYMPELPWKAFIDLEISEREYDRARQLYEELLERTGHVKVWLSYAMFEGMTVLAMDDDVEQLQDESIRHRKKEALLRSRAIFERALESLRTSSTEIDGQKEERAMVLKEWHDMERGFGDLGDASMVENKLPRRVKRRRGLLNEDGSSAGLEEYVDYVFPEETEMQASIMILEAAYRWKKQKKEEEQEN